MFTAEKALFSVTSFWRPPRRACVVLSHYLLGVTFSLGRKHPDFPDASRGRCSRTPCYAAQCAVWMQLVGWAEKRHHHFTLSLGA